ncbi:MAG: cupin domain-containing protein [Methanomassiliicoccales archaeon]|nr:MAG: cupin domain-containing protein [Methanomassiliicoccales archaeon]
MKTAVYDSFSERPNPHGASVRTIYDHPEAQVTHISLRPGSSLKRHVTPVDVFFYILEGEGEVEIGDEWEKVTKDMIIESPAKIPHRILNNGDSDLRFLVVKTPRPEQRSVLI